MKNLLLTIGLGIFSLTASYAQTTEKELNNEKVILVEVQPEYPGGMVAMYKFISDNVHYPKDAKKAGIQGKVLLQFTVDSKGNVVNVIVKKGLSESIDAEAVRVVNAMPKWKPGTQAGKAVNVFYNLPIEFKLK